MGEGTKDIRWLEAAIKALRTHASARGRRPGLSNPVTAWYEGHPEGAGVRGEG